MVERAGLDVAQHDRIDDMTEQDLTQVFVVTTGEYSDYRISSIWLTRDEAEAAADDGRIEVWPIGEHKRTLGEFSHSCDLDGETGEVLHEWSSDYADLTEARAEVCYWPGQNKLGIRVSAETQERADKVYSELRARVLADISTGLPLRTIATTEYVGASGWRPIRDA